MSWFGLFTLGKPAVNGIVSAAKARETFFMVLAEGFPSSPSWALHWERIKSG